MSGAEPTLNRPVRLEVRDLRFAYPDGTPALAGVSFTVEEGECLGLIGANGAGKSTLLLHLNGILPEKPAASPSVFVSGLPVAAPNLEAIRRRVGLLFQDPDDQLFCPTVYEDVAFGPEQFGLSDPEVRARVEEALALVGLSGFGGRSPRRLSRGEKQRVCLAGLLACRSDILVLDEPTSSLDPRGKRELKDLLRRIPATKLIATHDLELVVELCPRTLVLDGGVVVADGSTVELLSNEALMESHGLEMPHILRHRHPHGPVGSSRGDERPMVGSAFRDGRGSGEPGAGDERGSVGPASDGRRALERPALGSERPVSGEERGSALRRPRAVLFDLFHTLVDVNGAPGRSSSEILGIDPAVWNHAIFNEARHHALGEVSDPVESLRIIVRRIDPSIPEERIVQAAAARPARFRHALIHVRPEILAGVRRLRELRLKIGLLSNAGWDEIDAWPESPLASLFDAALFSCRERLMKPDPAFYRLGAERLEVPPEDCLFVGDGGSDEHSGARQAGMRTVLILGLLEESLPDLAARRPRNADRVVRTTAELADLVEALPP